MFVRWPDQSGHVQGQTADAHLVPGLEVCLALLGERLGRQPAHIFMLHRRARHEAVPRQAEDLCVELLLQLWRRA